MVHVFTQLNLKQGLKRFGNERIKETKSEMQQMHDEVVFHRIKGKQLTRIQKHGALQVLMFLKQKRCGKIKDHAIIDGQKQGAGLKKSDGTSPTAVNESVLTTAAIGTSESREVSVIYALEAFLMADIDKVVTVILENDMVDMMLEIDRKIYGKYVIYGENGKTHMYVCLSKAIYGTLKAALLYNRIFQKI